VKGKIFFVSSFKSRLFFRLDPIISVFFFARNIKQAIQNLTSAISFFFQKLQRTSFVKNERETKRIF